MFFGHIIKKKICALKKNVEKITITIVRMIFYYYNTEENIIELLNNI